MQAVRVKPTRSTRYRREVPLRLRVHGRYGAVNLPMLRTLLAAKSARRAR
jgi:hypothetical protein